LATADPPDTRDGQSARDLLVDRIRLGRQNQTRSCRPSACAPHLRQPIGSAIYTYTWAMTTRLPLQAEGFTRVPPGTAIGCPQLMSRDITVPDCVSHWLPFGFPPARTSLKQRLLSANVGIRGPYRCGLLAAIANEARTLQLWRRRCCYRHHSIGATTCGLAR
jgi:hypothetical protein